MATLLVSKAQAGHCGIRGDWVFVCLPLPFCCCNLLLLLLFAGVVGDGVVGEHDGDVDEVDLCLWMAARRKTELDSEAGNTEAGVTAGGQPQVTELSVA